MNTEEICDHEDLTQTDGFFIRDIECRWVGDHKGRGVFAVRPLPAGSIVEVSPVTVVPHHSIVGCEGSAIHNYLLYWTESEDAIGFGYLMLYNHSAQPTASFTSDYQGLRKIVGLRRDVQAGEELTIDYDCSLWFTPADHACTAP